MALHGVRGGGNICPGYRGISTKIEACAWGLVPSAVPEVLLDKQTTRYVVPERVVHMHDMIY